MYKAGKSWMVAPLVFFSLGAFSLGVTPVKADQVNAEQKAHEEDSSIYTASVSQEQRVVLHATSDASQAPESSAEMASESVVSRAAKKLQLIKLILRKQQLKQLKLAKQLIR